MAQQARDADRKKKPALSDATRAGSCFALAVQVTFARRAFCLSVSYSVSHPEILRTGTC